MKKIYNLPDVIEDEETLNYMSKRINETQRLIRDEGLPVPSRFYISQWLYESVFKSVKGFSKSFKFEAYYWLYEPYINKEIPVEVDGSLSNEQIGVEWE